MSDDTKIYGVGGLRVKQAEVLPNAIKSRHIENISWDKGYGGTLIIGGRNNVNGTFSLRDSSNIERISMNNSGITITDGKITIQNSSGTTILDTSGLVSTANFPNDEVVNSTGYTTASTSFVDVTGSSLPAFTLTRTTRVLVVVQAQMRNDNFNVDDSFARLACVDSVDGNLISTDFDTDWLLDQIFQDGSMLITGWSMVNYYQFLTVMSIFDMSAGSHVLKLQYRVVGTGTARIGTYILSYIVLGS